MERQLIESLIAEGESANLEFKIAPPRPTELAERICGMANGSGGYIIIGIADGSLEIVGVKNTNEAIDTIMQAVRYCKPHARLDPAYPEIIDIDGKKIIVTGIAPNDGTLYQAGNTFWIRRGTNTVAFSSAEIKDFLYHTGSMNWEALPVHTATLEDLNQNLINTYLQQRTGRGSNPRRLADPISVLHTIGCARISTERNGEEVIRPTNAGLLLFGEMPQDFIRQAEVMCVLFSDQLGLRRYRDRRTLNGPITQQIEQVEAFLLSNIKISAQMQGFHRLDMPDYPIEALREAVVNALVHRDYSVAGEIIRIFFFPDRIEIHSPGLLLPGVNLETLKRGQFMSKPRNAVLCDVLKDMPGNYMERMGSGIKYMVDTMREVGKPEPGFREESEFVVTFWNGIESVQGLPNTPSDEMSNPITRPRNVATPLSAGVSPEVNIVPASTKKDVGEFEPVVPSVAKPVPERRKELALRYVHRYGFINNGEYREITGVSEATALRDLEDLVKDGSLRAIGSKRNRKYML